MTFEEWLQQQVIHQYTDLHVLEKAWNDGMAEGKLRERASIRTETEQQYRPTTPRVKRA